MGTRLPLNFYGNARDGIGSIVYPTTVKPDFLLFVKAFSKSTHIKLISRQSYLDTHGEKDYNTHALVRSPLLTMRDI